MKSGMSASATGNGFGDGFNPGTVRGVLPFVIWAAHFFLSYASVEVACARGLQLYRLAGVPTISLWLWAITALTIGALVLLTARAARNVSAEQGHQGQLGQDRHDDGHSQVGLGVVEDPILGVAGDGQRHQRANRQADAAESSEKPEPGKHESDHDASRTEPVEQEQLGDRRHVPDLAHELLHVDRSHHERGEGAEDPEPVRARHFTVTLPFMKTWNSQM